MYHFIFFYFLCVVRKFLNQNMLFLENLYSRQDVQFFIHPWRLRTLGLNMWIGLFLMVI